MQILSISFTDNNISDVSIHLVTMKGEIQNDEKHMYKLLIYYLTYEYIVLLHEVKHFH